MMLILQYVYTVRTMEFQTLGSEGEGGTTYVVVPYGPVVDVSMSCLANPANICANDSTYSIPSLFSTVGYRYRVSDTCSTHGRLL